MFACILIIGLAVAGYLVHRHHRRVASPMPVAPAMATDARDLRAASAWQRNIRLDTRFDYTKLDPETREKLRREEERQRPQEGRN